MKEIAKLCIIIGISIIGIGGVLYVLSSFTHAGKLPGDIHMKGKGMEFFFPVTTCILISLVLTFILNLFYRGR